MGDRSTIRVVTGESHGMLVGIESYSHWGGYDALENALKVARPYSHDVSYSCRDIIMGHQEVVEMGGVQPFLCSKEDLFNFHNETEHPKALIDFVSETISVEIPGIGDDEEAQVKVFRDVNDVLIEFDTYYDRIEEFYRTNH